MYDEKKMGREFVGGETWKQVSFLIISKIYINRCYRYSMGKKKEKRNSQFILSKQIILS